MKKIVCGATAIAAGLVPAGAWADRPIRLELDGNFAMVAGAARQSDQPGQVGATRRSLGLGQDAKINFTGKTTLDNGIEVGVVVQLEPAADGRGNTNGPGGNRLTLGETDILDETYVFLQRPDVWGRVELGDRDGALNKMNVQGPFVLSAAIVGVNNITAVSAPPGNQAGTPRLRPGNGDASKIIYYTPRFLGLQLGASYAPDAVENQGRFGIGIAAPDSSPLAADAAQGNIRDVGVNFQRRIGAVELRASTGYWVGEQESSAAGTFDQRQWAVGGQMAIANWALGGSYFANDANVNTGGAANRRQDDRQYRVALTWSSQPWLAGVEYAQRAIDQTAGGKDRASTWGLSARRLLGPGVTLGAGIRLWDWADSTGARAAENDAAELLVETAFSF